MARTNQFCIFITDKTSFTLYVSKVLEVLKYLLKISIFFWKAKNFINIKIIQMEDFHLNGKIRLFTIKIETPP